MKIKSIIDTIEKCSLEKIILNSDSFREVISKLGLHPDGGGTNTKIRNRINDENISTLHFTGIKNRNIDGIKNHAKNIKRNIKEYLIVSNKQLPTHIKKRIINEGLLENKCCECGQLPSHNGKKLVLQIDHINGNSCDNSLQNLRVLCPNCHSQTHTFSGRNKKVNKTKNNCMYCGIEIYNKSTICKKCYNEKRKNEIKKNKISRKTKFNIDKDILEKQVMEMPILKIGKIYGVSDNAIRKRCKKLGIVIPKFKIGHWLKK